MASIFSFTCSCCGKVHEGAPGFSYAAPQPFEELPELEKQKAHLDTDTCWYQEGEEIHRFIRVCLEIPIHGFTDPFIWGVWVSLSEKSFNRYLETWKDPVESDSYFGWLCNGLPFYPDTRALKTNVRPRRGGIRPFVELQPSEHALVQDYLNGISVARAQEIAEQVMHASKDIRKPR